MTFARAVAASLVLPTLSMMHALGADHPPAGEGPPPQFRVFSFASFRPYAFFENGDGKGLAMDVARELAQRLHRSLDVMPLDLLQAEERLARGEADALFPMAKLSGTTDTFDFSDPVYQLHFAIFTSGSRSDIVDASDLRGLRVGVTASGFGRHFLQGDPAVHLVPMNDYAHGIALLEAGEVDAVIADRWVGASEIAARSIHDLRVVAHDVATIPAQFMVTKGNTALLAAINDGLRNMREDGTIERLREQWRPPDVAFVPGASVNWPVIIGGFAVLVLLLAAMGTWTIVLRREVALRREREREIATLHQRLAIATQAGGIGIWDWDVVCDVLVWDDEMFRLYGETKQEFGATFAAWVQTFHPEDRARVEADVRGALAGERPFNVEFRICRPDGTIRVIRAHAETFRDAAGRPRRMVGVNQDITVRQQAEVALVQSAERLRVALAASRLGIWRHDVRTRTVEWDERTRAIFGLSGDEPAPAGEAFLPLVMEEDRARVLDSWTRARGGEPYHVRFRARRRDGAIRDIESHGMLHVDADGQPEWVIGVANDVTEVVRAAEEAGHLRDQLLQSQKMETLGTLAASIAHDFNNLLTGINGFVELGAGSLAPDHEARGFLHNARQGVSQASDLVRRILQFSRRSSGSRRVPVRLDDLVRDTAPLISGVLPPNIGLLVQAGSNVAPVLADAVQMQQILMNLCVNGAHAIGGRDGTLRITVGMCEVTETGGPTRSGVPVGRYVRLAVTDTGSGMDEATVEKIFDPYFTTKRSGEGTGLGLAVVRGIAADHAAVIGVQSAVGQGSTFEILFPAATVEAIPPVAPVVLTVARGDGQRVLVVDDEQAVTEVARVALARAGYTVETRTSPVEAWHMIAAAPAQFDLLIVDQHMPQLPGTELIRRVRGVAVSLPVVLMSGQFERIDTDEVRGFGGVSLLEKPFDLGVLANTVEAALHERERPSASAM